VHRAPNPVAGKLRPYTNPGIRKRMTCIPEWGGEPVAPEPAGGPRAAKVKIRLADGKERSIRHMAMTSYWIRAFVRRQAIFTALAA
jgi:hypothetical protein